MINIDTSAGAKIENANIIKTDIEVSNGITHVIDAVIPPPLCRKKMQHKLCSIKMRMGRIFPSFFILACSAFFWMSSAYATECLGINDKNLEMCSEMTDKNVLGEHLAICCEDPKTGFYRNGLCQTGAKDTGTHIACAIMTDEFLEFTAKQGNDLVTPRPDYNFLGLKAGDKWCLCASRWMEALESGVAPKLMLEATHEKMREYVALDVLKKYAVSSKSREEYSMSKAGAYMFSFTSIDGQPMPLSDYAGQVILIVNTASQCGFTKQYKDLQALYERYKDLGFIIIGVPCNQFGGQEPGSESTIKDFAQKQFGVTFPLTSKADVSGKNAHPFFEWASDQNKGAFLQSSPKWNFHKFLINRQGQLIKSFGSHIDPDSSEIISEIEKLLAEKT